MGVTRANVVTHLRDTLRAAARWQAQARTLGERHAGGLACPVARTTMQWTEFFLLPLAVAHEEIGFPAPEAACLATGLGGFLARVQRPDGSFDAGFCGDLYQPCNAAFALRPLSDALLHWPAGFPEEARVELRHVLARAARACTTGGMNTANHRWVAAGGLAHAARALGEPGLLDSALGWLRAGLDVDEDGGFSEGSPNYALVSADFLLDLETLAERRDLGDVARRSLGYLRQLALADGGFATVASTRYDTEGSTDSYARAVCVLGRLGASDLAQAALSKLFASRAAPGVFAPHVFAPAGRHTKGKLYPSVVSAIAAESLLRWLRAGAPGAAPDESPPAGSLTRQRASGVLRYGAGAFVLAAGRGANLLEVHAGGAGIEAVRILVHAFGWNSFFVETHEESAEGHELALTAAPGAREIRLPQFLLEAPGERRPGGAVPVARACLRLRCGPGPQARLELDLEGPPGANAVLELAACSDQRLFSGDGAPLEAPVTMPPAGRVVVRGVGGALLVIDHEGGSGHALQLDPYGYGAADAPWSPSFHPLLLRVGLEAPARLALTLRLA